MNRVLLLLVAVCAFSCGSQDTSRMKAEVKGRSIVYDVFMPDNMLKHLKISSDPDGKKVLVARKGGYEVVMVFSAGSIQLTLTSLTTVLEANDGLAYTRFATAFSEVRSKISGDRNYFKSTSPFRVDTMSDPFHLIFYGKGSQLDVIRIDFEYYNKNVSISLFDSVTRSEGWPTPVKLSFENDFLPETE